MADSPAIKSDRVLSYTVYSEGKQVGGNYRLSEVWIRTGINQVGKAELYFDAGNMPEQSFPETDSDTFKPGAEIRVDLGYPEGEKTVFTGYVVMLNAEIREGHRSRMMVECRDALFGATLGRKNKVFEKQKDSEIIKAVLKGYGNTEVDETSYKHASLVQYYCSDFDFAVSRADANGLLVNCVNGKIGVKKPKVDASPVLTVTYGADLIDFDGGVSAAGQFGEVEAVAWDISKQVVITATASSPSLNQQGNTAKKDWETGDKFLLQTDVPAEESVLKKWADSVALKTGLARYRGSFSFHGSAAVFPGCIVELKGMGARYNGMVFVGAVEHTVKNQVWVTKVEMGIRPEAITAGADVVAPAAAGYLPGIEGLHIGKVKQLEEDPAKEFRILVEIPLLKDSKGVWARWATGYAGQGRGICWLPEKGDEVVVGFFNHDPGHPVILGNLYSSGQAAPYSWTKENDTKALITKEKLKIVFDEKKKIILVETPGKNKIELDDDGKCIRLADQNKNEIVMDKNGICLNSAAKIVLKAKMDLSAEATKVQLKAKADVLVEGANIKATAKIGFAAKGSATAELIASGRTTVKGGMVMIN